MAPLVLLVLCSDKARPVLAVALVFFVIVGTGGDNRQGGNSGAHWGRGSRGKAAIFKRTSAVYRVIHNPINTGPSLEPCAPYSVGKAPPVIPEG